MSGPKVVRIVTREEILAICEGHLRRLAQALAHWQAQVERVGEMDEEVLAAMRTRHERLRQLLRNDEFARLQKEVPAEIEFINRDLAQREDRAVAKAAHKRQSQRNLRENAAMLLRVLETDAGATSIEPSLLTTLQAIAADSAMDGAETILAAGFAHLSRERDTESLSESQRDLARALQLEKPSRWIAQERASREPRLERIDHHVAQLQTMYGTVSAEPFLQRLTTIENEPHPEQRNLLLDSLIVDIAKATADCQSRRSRLAALQSLAAELEPMLRDTATPYLSKSQLVRPMRTRTCTGLPN